MATHTKNCVAPKSNFFKVSQFNSSSSFFFNLQQSSSFFISEE